MMGLTAASLHILLPEAMPKPWLRLPGLSQVAATPGAVVQAAYAGIGWVACGAADPGCARHVDITIHGAPAYVSLRDSLCNPAESGMLYALARAISRRLRSAAIVATVTESDTFSFALFSEGRQVDAAGHPADPALTAVRGRRQAAVWRAAFGEAVFRALTAPPLLRQRERLADPLAIFQLRAGAATRGATAPADAALAAWCRLAGLPPEAALGGAMTALGGETVRLYFKPTDKARLVPPAPARTLYFDTEAGDYPYHGFFPAAWPVAPSAAQGFAWPVVCRDGGLRGFRLVLHMDRTAGFVLQRVSVAAYPYHGGAMASATPLARWGQTLHDDLGLMEADLCFDTDSFFLPDPGPGGAYALVIRADFATPGAGEIMITPSFRPDGPEAPPVILPTLRLGATRPWWLPIGYDPEFATESARDAMLRLNAPSVHTAVAILADTGDESRASLRRIIERYVAPMTRTALLATITTEKHRGGGPAALEDGPPGKRSVQTLPVQTLLQDPGWPRLFDSTSRLQTVRIGIGVEGAPWPLGGVTMQSSLRDQNGDEPETSRFGGPTLSVGFWTIAQDGAQALLGSDIAAARARFTHWVRGAAPIQAWLADCAWIPEFDTYASYNLTPYEAVLPLDWFGRGLAGTLTDRAWLRRHLRFVAPKLWLGWELAEMVDTQALTTFAVVREIEDGLEITLRDLRDMARLEAVLLAVLAVKV